MADSSRPRVQPFSWTGWNATSPGARATIAQRYGDPMTRWLAAPPVDNPNLSAEAPAEDTPTAPQAAPQAEAVAAGVPASDAQAAPMSPYAQTPATPAAPAPAQGEQEPTGLVNPNTGNPVADAWMRRGGSLATMHQGQREAGIRPAIDARATRSPQELGSQASADIRAGWGWPDTATGDTGTQIWDQMTQNFQNSAAATQTRNDRAARLAAAREKLTREFGPAIPAAGKPAAPANTAATGFDSLAGD